MLGETDTGSDHKYVEDKVDVSILQISCRLLLKIIEISFLMFLILSYFL